MFYCVLDHALKKNLKLNGLQIWFYNVFLCVSAFHYHHFQLDSQKVTHLLSFPEYLKCVGVGSLVVVQVCCSTEKLHDLIEITAFLVLHTNSTRCHLVSRWRRRFQPPAHQLRVALWGWGQALLGDTAVPPSQRVPSSLKGSWRHTGTCRELLMGPFPLDSLCCQVQGTDQPQDHEGLCYTGINYCLVYSVVELDVLSRKKIRVMEKYQNGENGCIISELLNLSVVRPVLFLGINPQLPASSDKVRWPSWLQPFFLITEDNSPIWVLAQSSTFFSVFLHSPCITFLYFYVFSWGFFPSHSYIIS